ncbi:MAG TPA: ferrous iron transport protein B, partial [Clostridiales bacterium]|nr:ferrous iron transport protein B [Clostridiales bacterium]
MIFALIGNQNCGKTTLFNALTGANRHVGNFPGVTVDEKSGTVRGHAEATVVDLPGIYSLRPYTNEEIVTRDFLLNGHPDGIINIVDATNIERNLYLTLQLLEIGLPTVLALNMMDEVRENGGTVEIDKLSEELGIPVVPISAAKNEGVDELIDRAISAVKNGTKPKRIDFCPAGPIHRCIHAVAHLIEDHAVRAGMPARFAATKVIEEDRDIVARLSLDENEREMIWHSVLEMEREAGLDRHEALAAMRYDFIERVCAGTVVKCHESRERRRSLAIDRVLTHKVFAIPVFLFIMLTVFTLTFAVIGDFFSNLLEAGIGALGEG